VPREPEDPKELGAAETVVDASGPTLVAPLVSVAPPGDTRVSGLRKGDVLGRRYELLAEIGRGAHGAVFRAFDRHADEQVALKIMLAPSGEQLALHDILTVDVATGRVLRAVETAAEHLLRVIPTDGDELYAIEQRWRGSIFLAELGNGDDPALLDSAGPPAPPTAPRAR
jgi:hypothetical protein